MKNKEVRKLRREICKNFRMMNNNLCDDYLWRGRFEVRMKDFQYRKYFDNSGYQVWVCAQFIDHKTGQTKDLWGDYFDWTSGWKVFVAINNFIVEDCHVWEYDKEDPNYPTNDKTVYRGK